MGWATKQPNGLWRARWRGTDGREQSDDERFTTQSAARRYATQRELDTRGRPALPSDGMTWSQWKPIWQQNRHRELSARELIREESIVRLYVEPYWGERVLADITRTEVRDWVDTLTDSQLSSDTVAKIYRKFSNSMRKATLHEPPVLLANPCLGVTPPPPIGRREKPLLAEQMVEVMSHLELADQFLFWLDAYTGMRPGELFGLHWSAISYETGHVYVQDVWEIDRRAIRGLPKNRKPRPIALVPDALTLLSEWRALRPPAGERCGLPHVGWHGIGPGTKCTSALVFAPDGGIPPDISALRRRLKRACALAGVDHRTVYDMRHTCATWLRLGGAGLEVVQAVLGHSSIRTTERYLHIGSMQGEVMTAALGQAAELRRRSRLTILPGGADLKFAANPAASRSSKIE